MGLYDTTIDDSVGKDFDLGEWLKSQPKMYPVPSNKWCLELACKVPYNSVSELINNAEKIKEYCK